MWSNGKGSKKAMKRVFYCTNFEGVYPTRVCAIVVADSPKDAARFLRALLKKRELKQYKGWKPDMVEVYTEKEGAIMINDGDY